MLKYLLTTLLLLIFGLSEAQTTINGSFDFGGKIRTYSFYVPASYLPGQPVPLVVGLHGLTSSGSYFAQYRDFKPIADTANFIVLNPDGATLLGVKYWNYENIAGTNVDDVGFIEALIDTISAHYSIDQNRVYCTGMSNGSFMACYLACQSDRFAAVGGVTGSMSNSMYANCNPSHPTPIIHIHDGTSDDTNPYDGTSTMTPIADLTMFWVNQNNCNPTPLISSVADLDSGDNATAEHYVYIDGIDGNTIEHFKVLGGGHSWPGGPTPFSSEVTCMDFNASKEIWRFFSQYEKSETSSLNDTAIDEIEIWPIPANKTLNFKGKQIEAISILDLEGKVVLSRTDFNNSNLDVSHLFEGNYLLKLLGKDFQIIRKIQIQRP